VYNFDHPSITRHLRDMVVTEYGITNVRGKPDSEVIMEILKITDLRFQEDQHFAAFPFGTDFTAEEIVIGGSLKSFNGRRKTGILKKIFF